MEGITGYPHVLKAGGQGARFGWFCDLCACFELSPAWLRYGGEGTGNDKCLISYDNESPE